MNTAKNLGGAGLSAGELITSPKRLQYLDGLIVFVAALLSGFIYQYPTPYIALKYIMVGVAASIGIYYAGMVLFRKPPAAPVPIQEIHSDIKTVALLNENGKLIKEWNIHGKMTMLIGKQTKRNEVDIDLSDSAYDALIHDEHALMNFAAGNWYLEGLHMPSGISVKKGNDRIRYRLVGSRPCRLEPGDVLYIANTRLLMK